jgi:hypothetical protein
MIIREGGRSWAESRADQEERRRWPSWLDDGKFIAAAAERD